MSKSFDRRTFLAALGLGTGAAFLPSLGGAASSMGGPSSAAAQEEPAKRLLIMTTAHGTIRSSWKMQGPGLPMDQDVEFSFNGMSEAEFSPILKPLYAHREKLLVVEGLAQSSSLADERANNHWLGRAHLLTGGPHRMEGQARPTSPSIDQIVSASVRRSDRLASLEYGADTVLSSGEGGELLPSEDDPGNAFDRLFPTGSEPALSPDQLVRSRRASVLDLASREYARVAPKLGLDDKRRMEQHRDLIRDLENRLASPLHCEAPSLLGSDEKFDEFARLITAAFACDMTRVATLRMKQLVPEEFGAPSTANVHGDYAHTGRDTPRTDEEREGHHWMTEYNKQHARQFSRLLDMLDGIPEGDGTMLDNSCVVWLTEMANGRHYLHDIPVVMAGSCGGALGTGRYLRFAQNRPAPNRWYYYGGPIGASHSQLLISIAQAMGVDLNALPITDAPTDEGIYDMTGPLPGLAG